VETTTQRIVSNEYGVSRTQTASGKYQRIYFRLRNMQQESSSVTGNAFTLTDAQGRKYSSDFEVRQVQPDGTSSPFGGSSIAPGATVALNLTFDVASDATGLVLHLVGASDLKLN